MANIEQAVVFMVSVANNDKHGYDQTHRNSPDYDCSSLVGTALHEAGFDVSPYSWTGNLRKQLLDNGFKTLPVNADRLRGDIFLTEKHHVVMCVDKNNIVHATSNELGKATGGKTGDQTGKEICVRSFYTPSFGWDYHFRYEGTNDNEEYVVSVDTIAREVIAGRWGNGTDRQKRLTTAGYNYQLVQARVNAILSGKVLKSNEEIAREVIKGLWSNGVTRKERLTQLGYDYVAIQKLVNQMLK